MNDASPEGSPSAAAAGTADVAPQIRPPVRPPGVRDAVGGPRPPAVPARASIGLGIAGIVGAGFLFSSSHAMIKFSAGEYSIIQLVFFRSFFALIPLAPFLVRDGPEAFRTRRAGLHAFRTLSGLASMACFYYALAFLPLADITVINFTMPLFVTALSMPLLGEKVGWRRLSAVVVGFTGILLMVRPGSSILDPANAIALTSAFLYALAVIAMRQLGATERSSTTTLYFTLASLALSGATLPFVWRTPDGFDWIALVMLGLLGGFGQLLMTVAYRSAPAAIVAPFDYVAMVWATVYGYVLWDDVPTAGVFAGAAIVIASGLYIIHRETKLFGLWRRRAIEREPTVSP